MVVLTMCVVTSVALHDHNLSWYSKDNYYLSDCIYEYELLLHYILV